MSGHAHTANDQVDDILEMFYADEQFPADDEQEDLAFYDLYQDEEEPQGYSPDRQGLWSPFLEPNDLDAKIFETDEGRDHDHQPTSTGIALAEVNKRLTNGREDVSDTENGEEANGGDGVDETVDGEFVKDSEKDEL